MGALFEELEAREVAARVRVEELEAEVAELAGKLELARESLERLRIARETVADVLAEMTSERSAAAVAAGQPAAGERLVAQGGRVPVSVLFTSAVVVAFGARRLSASHWVAPGLGAANRRHRRGA